MKNILFRTILFLIVLGPVSTASAQLVKSAHVEAQLLADTEWIQPGEPFWIGIELKMDEGWHTYWKNPGDSGLATSVKWTLPEGFEAGPIQWPYPQRFEEAELATYGYEGEVTLLVEITPSAVLPEESVQTLGARVRWLSCERICIPGQAELTLDLPVKNEPPVANPSYQQDFEQARGRLPLKDHGWQIGVEHHLGRFSFQLKPPARTAPVNNVYFFPETNDLIDHAADQHFRKDARGYRLSVAQSAVNPGQKHIKGVLILTMPEGVTALDVDAVVRR